MKKERTNPLVFGIGGLLLGGFAVWFMLTSSVINQNFGMMSGRNTVQKATQNSNSLDAHFIEQMIPHHEDAITMAKLAQTKAKRPEVKQLAQNIITSQGTEIDQMRNWYSEWFGKEVASGVDVHSMHGMTGGATQNSLHMGMMGDMSDTTRLETATDFDRAFVEDMIPHHQMAVMMATMLKNGTNRPEMSNLADDIIAAQTKEIDEMRMWLNEWGSR